MEQQDQRYYSLYFPILQLCNQCNHNKEKYDRTTHEYLDQEGGNHHNTQFFEESYLHPSNLFLIPIPPKHSQIDPANQIKIKQQDLQIKKKEIIKRRSDFTLCNLTKTVFEIVQQANGLKSKEIADKVVDNIQLQFKNFERERDHRNIRRRVYDSLNVMASVGILKRQKFHYNCNQLSKHVKSSIVSSRNQRKQKQKLQQQLKLKLERVQAKRNLVQSMRKKKKNLQQILMRNKQQQNSGISQNILKFPLIATLVDSDKLQQIEQKEEQVQLLMGQNSKVYGDIDLLARINEASSEEYVGTQVKIQQIYNESQEFQQNISIYIESEPHDQQINL